nr:EOG090X04KW [Eulimnadia texana]
MASSKTVFSPVKAKNALKVKLMMRRPYKQLVDQGIVPPYVIIAIYLIALKTPVTFHEQRQKLQRAKMGDLLKHKIQHRPDRTELIRQHILEADTNKIDPSLAERQRMLKRAKLADSLNDQLSHRPGPLELVQKNILHTDENVERAIKEGQIAFRATCEGSLIRPTHLPDFSPECDDSSSEGSHLLLLTSSSSSSNSSRRGLSPSQDGSLDGCSASSNGPPSLEAPAEGSVASSTSTLSPANFMAASPAPILTPVQNNEPVAPPPPPLPPAKLFLPVIQRSADLATVSGGSSGSSSSSGSKNRKKSKPKCQPKPRTIKFHEYKGPPNAQKQQNSPPAKVETSYELLLQQQQLFLQWQLEWQHKYPQIILPASQKPQNPAQQQLPNPPPPSSETPATPAVAGGSKSAARLEEMKVSDLKAELKKRNLPVSGSKPQLVERLRLFCNDDGTLSERPVSRRGSQAADELALMPSPSAASSSNASVRRISCSSLDGSLTSMSPASIRPPSVAASMDVDHEPSGETADVKNEPPPTPPPLPGLIAASCKVDEKPSPSKLLLQQQLQMKIQQQQQQQQQHLQNVKQVTPAAYHVVKEDKGLPSFCDMFSGAPQLLSATTQLQRPAPPEYAQVVSKQRPSIKSQLVDDVLDILIRNGELPPSAANDPVTPTTPRTNYEALQYPAVLASTTQQQQHQHQQQTVVEPPPPPPPPLPSQLLSRAQNGGVDIKFPDININDLGLDLDSFAEAMELGLENVSQAPSYVVQPTNPGGDEVTAMDLDVADWLDTLLPPTGAWALFTSSSTTVFKYPTKNFIERMPNASL